MSWLATIRVQRGSEDVLSSRLWDLGSTGIAELADGDGPTLLAGFETEQAARGAVATLGLPGIVGPVNPNAWSGPGPATVNVGSLQFTIDPEQSFGDGGHQSTRLCLDYLEQLVKPGMSVLDAGTGSGILAIAAAKLGADRVVGIDCDDAAIETARQNAAANSVAIELSSTDISALSETFDLVVVNMLVMDLEPIAGHVRRAANGSVIVAGCLSWQSGRAAAALNPAGVAALEIRHQRELDGWAGLVLG